MNDPLEKGKEIVALRIDVHIGKVFAEFNIDLAYQDPDMSTHDGLSFYSNYHTDKHKYRFMHFHAEMHDYQDRAEPVYLNSRIKEVGSFGVSLEDAEASVKVLRSMNRKLDKMTDELGMPMDFSEHILRIAQVFNAKIFFCKNAPNEYHAVPIRHLRGYIQTKCKEATSKFEQKTA